VTEPDPVAALADQVEQLRAQLARYTGETGQLRARFDEGAGREAVIRLEIKHLAEKVGEAAARRQAEDPQAPYWLGLSEGEHAARLTELRGWVEQVGNGQYPGYFARIQDCWPAHREAVIELSTLMSEWIRIYGDPDSRPLADALVFHDRWLPGIIGRLAAVIKCGARCQLTMSLPWERSPPASY